MNAPRPIIRLSVEEYLAAERSADVRHEYVDGELFAMTGASRAHNAISLNIAAALLDHLRDGPCRVAIAGMKVRIESLNRFYYPDVVVSCNAVEDEPDDYVETRPTLVVEVLSPSTAATDRREKRLGYQTLPSLQEYVLVHQDRVAIELFRRQGDLWTRAEHAAGERIALPSIGFEAEPLDFYRGSGMAATDGPTSSG